MAAVEFSLPFSRGCLWGISWKQGQDSLREAKRYKWQRFLWPLWEKQLYICLHCLGSFYSDSNPLDPAAERSELAVREPVVATAVVPWCCQTWGVLQAPMDSRGFHCLQKDFLHGEKYFFPSPSFFEIRFTQSPSKRSVCVERGLGRLKPLSLEGAGTWC